MNYRELPPSTRDLSRVAAIVGVGESDYGDDYRAARARAEGYVPPTPEGLAITVFERALADAGLLRSDIDGLAVAFMYGGPTAEETAGLLGIQPRYLTNTIGIMAGIVPRAVGAIASGECDTIALVYAVATRSIGRKFGGQNFAEGGGAPASYYYYHPWGWSSQAAHWAMTWQYYRHLYGLAEDGLAPVAMQLRDNARRHAQAIMQTEITPDAYTQARYVVQPLRLLDLCLVNDGGVCLIITRADKARDTAKTPVAIAGWGSATVKADKLDALVRQQLRPQFQHAGAQTLAMAGLSLSDVRHFEAYDAATIHLVNHIEGHGFAEPGTAIDAFRLGEFGQGGRVGINTAGGMLSGSYMHGWNSCAEIVRQLRHEAGDRQVPDVESSLFSLAETDRVSPVLFTRGA
ncbi:MAG TPA: thiolase family protein [Sphingobium sp.]|uniref:thiolase family protein n=1 Tax=Sphingobium sp. TaxID=1912891 RepID=UPI002ED4EB5E